MVRHNFAALPQETKLIQGGVDVCFYGMLCFSIFGLPWWLSGKESTSSEEMWRSPGERNGSPLQDFCLGNPMDGQVWWATVPGVAKELDTTQRLKRQTTTFQCLKMT